ncbi:hypothetical protein LPJ59_002550, partial [Coemansia sp. RSA 2399]
PQQPLQSHETVDLETWLSPLMFTPGFGSPSTCAEDGVASVAQTADPLQTMITPVITGDTAFAHCASTAMVLTPESIAPQHESYARSPADFATTSPMGSSTLPRTGGQADCYKTYPQDAVGYIGSSEGVADALLAAIAAAGGGGDLNKLQAEASRVPGFMHALGHQTLVHQVNPSNAATASAVGRQGAALAASEIDRRPSMFQGSVQGRRNGHNPPRTTAAHYCEHSNAPSPPSMQNFHIYFPSLCGVSGMRPSDIPDGGGRWPYVTHPDTLSISRPQLSITNRPMLPTPVIAVPGDSAYNTMYDAASTAASAAASAEGAGACFIADSSGYGDTCAPPLQYIHFLPASCASSVAGEDDIHSEQQSLPGSTLCASAAAVTRCASSASSSAALINDSKLYNCRNSNAPRATGGNSSTQGARKRKYPSLDTSDPGTSDSVHRRQLSAVRGCAKRRKSTRGNNKEIAADDDDDSSTASKSRFRLNDDQKRCFYKWIVKNINSPYPSEDDRENDLAIEGISKQRFKWWFSNHRHRSLKVVTGEDGSTSFVPRLSFYKACAKLGVELDWEIPDDISAMLDTNNTRSK